MAALAASVTPASLLARLLVSRLIPRRRFVAALAFVVGYQVVPVFVVYWPVVGWRLR